MRIRFPGTEEGWISLGKRAADAKLRVAKDSTPRAGEIKKYLRLAEKSHRLSKELRLKAENAEKSERSARRAMIDILRRRGQALLMANRRDPNSVREAGYEMDE